MRNFFSDFSEMVGLVFYLCDGFAFWLNFNRGGFFDVGEGCLVARILISVLFYWF